MKSNKDNSALTGLIALLFVISLIVTIAIGWAANIISLVHMTGFSGMMVARCAGIFLPPLGAILGYAF
jgi:uncharacterized membrane protein